MQVKAEQIQMLYRHDFGAFSRFAFHELNAGVKYQHNWHVDVLTDALQKVEAGEITRLIINLPPRMLKSHCASIAFPAWALARNPKLKILCLSGSHDLSCDLEENFRQLVQSNRYKGVFQNISYSASNKKHSTNYGGFRRSACMDSSLTGVGADIVIIDDPLSTQKANDENERRYVNQMFDQNIYQRMNDKKSGAIIVVMQRLHDDDLCGHILKKSDHWYHINLPAFAVTDEEWRLSRCRIAQRRKWDALQPNRESFDDLVAVKRSIGAEAFSSQYLQMQLLPQYCAIRVPKQYRSFNNWLEQDPEAVFEATFMHDNALVIIPEPLSIEEWQERHGK